MLINKKTGSIFCFPSFKSFDKTFDSYRSDNLETISMLKGIKKAIIAASKATISDKKIRVRRDINKNMIYFEKCFIARQN